MSILDLFLAAISLAPLGFLLLFWTMFRDDRGIHPIYRGSGSERDTEEQKYHRVTAEVAHERGGAQM